MQTLKRYTPFIVGLVIGGVFGYFLCAKTGTSGGNVGNNLITNQKAISMINNYNPCDTTDTTTVSGHIEIGVLLGYIEQMTTQCESIGYELSGLEYYFAKYVNENENRRTVVIYPTLKDSVGPNEVHHIPFDPFLSSPTDTMTVVDIRQDGFRTSAINNSQHVLDRTNMSPPRKPTF